MAILDKLMEKKDLKIYIEYRIKELSREKKHDMSHMPESERGFIQERYLGRILELKKLQDVLARDLLKERSKIYYKRAQSQVKK